MRTSARRIAVVLSAAALLIAAAAPANAAQIVNGTIAPSGLRGQASAVMFFHPF